MEGNKSQKTKILRGEGKVGLMNNQSENESKWFCQFREKVLLVFENVQKSAQLDIKVSTSGH